MDISLFDYAPMYIPTDLRKLISFYADPLHIYLGCVVEDRNYIHVLGVCRSLAQAGKLCLTDKAQKIRINPARYHIVKLREGEILPNKICSRLMYPPQIHSIAPFEYRTRPDPYNTTCSFCIETFEISAPVAQLPCKHLFHFKEIKTWLKNSLHCPLCRRIVRNDPPSLLEVGELVYIDEGYPYAIGEGGPRRFTLSLSKSSQKHLDYYDMMERNHKIKLHPKGGGVPRPCKFFVQ